jgi:cytochrome c biogenesis protein CcmG/thiol:disulfide interchange protein DsbE
LRPAGGAPPVAEEKQKVSRLAFAVPAVFFALVGVFVWGLNNSSEELPSTLIAQTAPPLNLTELGDSPLPTDADLRADGVKIVNFWASWCAPCRVEHPILMDLAAEGIPIIGVNYKDQPENALGFLNELGDPYAQVGADANGRNGIEWGLYGVPETFVIDGDGNVVLRFPGPVTEGVLTSRIRPAIEEARR